MPNSLIHTTEWNVLVILDAMRYDYFERMCHLKGRLTKVRTDESCTSYWLINNFGEYYPITYITANPYISRNVAIRENWIGGKHFEQIVEVWIDGWDNEFKTVLPHTVTNAARPYLKEEKIIIHYLQPHMPGIGDPPLKVWAWMHDEMTHKIIEDAVPLYGVPIETLQKAYESNAKIVLEEMDHLLELIDPIQRIIITSDHGEMLGENGYRVHPCKLDDPILRDVPWFEVKR